MADLTKNYSITLLFSLLLISICLLLTLLSRRRRRLPPSPLRLPIIGHLHLLGPILHQKFHKLSTIYGPLVHIYVGSVPCVIASSVEIAKEFLKTNELSFSSRPVSAAVHHMSFGSSDFFFSSYGPYWKLMKKVSMTELLGGRTLEQLQHVRREERHRFLQTLLVKSCMGKGIVNVHAELVRLTNNVISKMTMNRRLSELDNEAGEVRELVEEIVELTGKFNLSDFIWLFKYWDVQGVKKRYEKACAKYNKMIEKIIHEHEEERKWISSREAKDVLHLLLDISDDLNKDDGANKLTRNHIKAFILDLFIAGTHTSAITVEWALAELINNQHVLEKAREEIDKVIGKNRAVEESDIPNLPYLQAIVKETLRLHPAGPIIIRESDEDCTVGGYHIPAKTRLFVNVWALGRDPQQWESPLEFNPNRFIVDAHSKLDVRGQHFQFLPFGTGRRGCTGTTLGMQVVQATLASVIQCFDFKIRDGASAKVDMEEGGGVTLPRANPLNCTLAPRLNLLQILN